ncbi:DNA base-flipping protein [Dipodascopsis uninucleata]
MSTGSKLYLCATELARAIRLFSYRLLTEEAESFYIAVYEMVQRIPEGKVTTYGHIARLISAPQNSRQVGNALKYLPRARRHASQEADSREDESVIEHEFSSGNVPWWRVISSSGRISFRQRGGMDEQVHRLQREGIEVRVDENHRPRKIDLREYGWFPRTEDDDADGDE